MSAETVSGQTPDRHRPGSVSHMTEAIKCVLLTIAGRFKCHLKVIYHPLYGMNNYVLIWGDWLSW